MRKRSLNCTRESFPSNSTGRETPRGTRSIPGVNLSGPLGWRCAEHGCAARHSPTGEIRTGTDRGCA
eukprot:3008418-Prymnesium_polylepis.1